MKNKKGDHVHTYPFDEKYPFGPERAHCSFVETANHSTTADHVSLIII